MTTNKIDLFTQSGQGNKATKTLRYEGDQVIEDDNDLITKGYVAPMQSQLAELLPPDAESLHNKTLALAGTTQRTGYLSTDPAATYEAGKPAGSQVSYIVNDPTFTLTTPNASTAVNQGDKGQLELHINGTLTDSFDLDGRFDENNRAGSQAGLPEASANGQIIVTSIEKYAISLWQKINAYVSIKAADLVTGYNEIVLKHTGTDGGDQIAQVAQFFYDTGAATPTITVLTLSIHDNSSPKNLSGVRFLGAGDQVKVSATGNALYDNTYVLDPIRLSGLRGVPTTTVAPTDGSVSGLSAPPVVGEVMQVTDKVLTLSSANQCTADGRITGQPKDPHGSYSSVLSASQNLLISTFGQRSNNTTEHFDDEAYRLPLTWDSDDTGAGITGHWDSTALLANGDAQQYVLSDNEHGLIYPNTDFTGFLPTNTADYTAHSGDQVYQRAFITPSPKSSIQFVLGGVAGGIGQIGSGDMTVEVKLPGQTGWLDCAKPFDGSAGVANDGDGAMVGNISYSGGNATLNATFGGKSSYDANNRCLIRITLRNGNRTVKQISTNW
ncbi:MAG: hypothetical protein R3F02_18770 [Thiolinea sp.]